MRRWLIAILAIAIVALLPTWPFNQAQAWGYYPSALAGIVLIAMVLMSIASARRSST